MYVECAAVVDDEREAKTLYNRACEIGGLAYVTKTTNSVLAKYDGSECVAKALVNLFELYECHSIRVERG